MTAPTTRPTALVEQVACPHCGVRVGRRCKEPCGADRRPGEYHRARIKAWKFADEDEGRMAE